MNNTSSDLNLLKRKMMDFASNILLYCLPLFLPIFDLWEKSLSLSMGTLLPEKAP